MIFSRLLKCHRTSTLIALLVTLQITACSTEDFLTAVAPDIGSAPETETSNNQAAIITGVDNGSVIEDVDPDGDSLLETSGKLDITDSDEGEAAFIEKAIIGTYGNLEIDTSGNWNYAADNNQDNIQDLTSNATLTDNMMVNSVDGTEHMIAITIIGVIDTGSTPNNPAIINGNDSGSVTEDIDPDNDSLLEVSGTLNITDPDTGEAAFIATTFNGSYGGLTINTAGNWSYAANNNQAVIQNLATGATLTDNLTISSVDGTTHTIAITLLGADENNTLSDITLSWVAPIEREDNTALSLSAIAGYKVYFGTTPGQYPNSISINDGSATGHIFNDFSSATYYFVITTIDSDGRESQQSSEVTISI